MNKLSSMQKVLVYYIFALCPSILYGFYKNGINLFQRGYIDFFGCLKPVLLPVISIILGVVIEIIHSKIRNEKANTNVRNSFLPMTGLILSCIINPSIGYIQYFIMLIPILIIIKLLSIIKKIEFNYPALAKIMLFVIVIVFVTNSYQNLYEANVTQALDNTDYLFGRGVGGLASTSVLLSVVGYIFLCFTDTYKKEIPLYSTIIYLLLLIIYCLITNAMDNIFVNLFTNTVIFSFIFIAPDSVSTPYTKKGKIIFSILLGIITFVLTTFILPTEGVFISIFIVSIFSKLFDKLFALK